MKKVTHCGVIVQGVVSSASGFDCGSCCSIRSVHCVFYIVTYLTFRRTSACLRLSPLRGYREFLLKQKQGCSILHIKGVLCFVHVLVYATEESSFLVISTILYSVCFISCKWVILRTTSASQCVGVERGGQSISSEGSGVRVCVWREHVARRRHKKGALNAANKE